MALQAVRFFPDAVWTSTAVMLSRLTPVGTGQKSTVVESLDESTVRWIHKIFSTTQPPDRPRQPLARWRACFVHVWFLSVQECQQLCLASTAATWRGVATTLAKSSTRKARLQRSTFEVSLVLSFKSLTLS